MELADEICQKGLAAAQARPEWQQWFATQKCFQHPAVVNEAIARHYGLAARDVTSEANWQKLGYVVGVEAKGLEVEGTRYYHTAEVVAQAGAQPLWFAYANIPAGDASPSHITELIEVLSRRGWQVHFEAGVHQERAMTDHPAKTIYVQPTETPLGLLNRIGHEVGHVLLHPGGWGGPKWTQEVEAQGFAWQLLARWGSEVSDYSCTYILGWSEGRAVEELVFGARVQAALRELEREIGGAGMEAVDVEVGGMR